MPTTRSSGLSCMIFSSSRLENSRKAHSLGDTVCDDDQKQANRRVEQTSSRGVVESPLLEADAIDEGFDDVTSREDDAVLQDEYLIKPDDEEPAQLQNQQCHDRRREPRERDVAHQLPAVCTVEVCRLVEVWINRRHGCQIDDRSPARFFQNGGNDDNGLK